MASDYREIASHLRAMSQVRKLTKQPLPMLTQVGVSQKDLAEAWGVNKDAPRQAFLAQTTGKSRHFRRYEGQPPKLGNRSVIDCRSTAKSIYTPWFLFKVESLRRFCDKVLNPSDKELAKEKDRLVVLWKKLPTERKSFWETKARVHDEEWPWIKDRILISIRQNETKSYREIERDIDGWCSYDAIMNWLHKQESFTLYCQRVVPFLSDHQKIKHVTYANMLHNYWELSPIQLQKVMKNGSTVWSPGHSARPCRNMESKKKSFVLSPLPHK